MQTQGWLERDATEVSGGLLSCSACHEEVTSGAAARCPACRALYHVPCWNELTGCVTEGCRGHQRVPNRGPLTLVSEPVEVVEAAAPATVDAEPVRLPTPRVELLPPSERPAPRRMRRRDWMSTVAVAVIAVLAGIAGTLALIHRSDVSHQQPGYRSGWQAGYRAGSSGAFDSGFKKGNQAGWKAGYDQGYLQGCHAAHGAEVTCTNAIVPAAGPDGGPGTPEPATTTTVGGIPASDLRPAGNKGGGTYARPA